MKDPVSACPLESAMLLLSGRWRALIIYWLSEKPMRFNELRRANNGISHRMLALDLRELEAAGVVSRATFPTVPPQVEYALTEKGQRLMPLLARLGDWWAESERQDVMPFPLASSAG